jgi:GNAT superfamily N-acetyltransferase
VTPRRVDPSREPATLTAMDEVMQRAYGVASFRSSIERFVAAQPDGIVVVERDGRVAGCGCCIAYVDGGFGWIGLVATDPGYQRLGIATAVTDALSDILAGHGCASVLDASAAGAPVYERMGFADHGITEVLSWENRHVTAPDGTDCAGVDVDDADVIDAVVRYDADRFGSSRPELLRALFAQCRGRAVVARRGGVIAGYLVGQEAALAPVVADDSEALSALLAHAAAMPWSAPPRINVPPESAHTATLLDRGFERRRQLRHMRRGIGALPGRRDRIAGTVSLGEG